MPPTIQTRPDPLDWHAYPGQERTLVLSEWPDGLIDGRTFELRIRGVDAVAGVLDTGAETVSFTVELPATGGNRKLTVVDTSVDPEWVLTRGTVYVSDTSAGGSEVTTTVTVTTVDEVVLPITVTILGGSSGATSLDDLTDVDTTGATDGQALVFDDGTDTWGPGTISGSGAVDSVNGETGTVVLTAAEIGSSTTGDVAATDVQGAIAELASEKATVAALAAEATLARNADNLTSGTVADARIASTIARDSEVAAAYQPLTTAAMVEVSDADETYTRRGIRFINGANTTVEIADDAGDDEVEVTISSSGGGGGAVVADGDYGDVTVSGTGTVWTIDNGVVTAAKVAADVATQAELDAEATLARNADNLTSGTVADARVASTIARDSEVTAAVAAEAVLARNADNLTSGTVADARIASTIARDSEVTSAISASEAGQVRDGDTAGGVLAGTYPSPSFAVDQATQAELDAAIATRQPLDADLTALAAAGNSSVLAATTAAYKTADETKVDHLTVTQAVNLDDLETRVASLDAAVVLRGTWDASAGTFPGGGTAQAGDSYIVSVAGTVNAVAFAVGDRIIAIADNASTSTFAANWFKADYTDLVSSVNTQTGAVVLTATNIGSTATGDVAATNVQAAIAELASEKATTGSVSTVATDLSNHLADTSDAHDASAISILDSANDFTATDVEGALAELQTADEADEAALAAHLADTSDAHDASAVSYAGGTGMSATDVEAAIDELATEKANTADLPEPNYGLDVQGGFLNVEAAHLTVIDATGTYTKPEGCRVVYVVVIGGGAGGASGYRDAEGTNRYGGGGGAAGRVVAQWIAATDLDTSEAVTIGAGGAGGAALTSNGVGNAGTAGGDSVIDTISGEVRALGGAPGSHGGGYTPGLPGNSVWSRGGQATLADPSTNAFLNLVATKGENGGGGSATSRTAANANAGGGNGGTFPAGALGGVLAAGDAGAGGQLGGGGGGAITAVATGNVSGFAGGFPGGGGGGGSFGTGVNSGAGGAGAAGRVVVVAFF